MHERFPNHYGNFFILDDFYFPISPAMTMINKIQGYKFLTRFYTNILYLFNPPFKKFYFFTKSFNLKNKRIKITDFDHLVENKNSV